MRWRGEYFSSAKAQLPFVYRRFAALSFSLNSDMRQRQAQLQLLVILMKFFYITAINLFKIANHCSRFAKISLVKFVMRSFECIGIYIVVLRVQTVVKGQSAA